MGLMHQMFKPVPGKFKDYIAIPKPNGYQSLHTTLIGPAGINIEFQLRTHAMDVVAESGVAAHWLYKADENDAPSTERMNAKWLQSLLDIHDETRDATEFFEHVKIDLFPDDVYVFTPKNKIITLPRGATVIDFAYAIHTNMGDRATAAKINGLPVPLRTEVKNGDIIEVTAGSTNNPNPAWLNFVKTARARSKIRHHLKSMALTESVDLGEKLLSLAIRAEGVVALPAHNTSNQAIWDKLLRFTGNRDVAELMSDIALGKRIASIVAKRLAKLLVDSGKKLDTLLITRERFLATDKVAASSIILDGSESASVQYASCCRPVPGDAILGYLGRGEGLAVHVSDCNTVQRLQKKDAERFIPVEWSDEPVRNFEVGVLITVVNGKGVLAKVSVALANAEVDISHVDMGKELAQEAIDLRFILSVRDKAHLEEALNKVRRTDSVISATRISPTRSSN